MYDPLQVNLPYFDGPLDLLLHLVRKQELDIHEVRVSELTEPYLAYVERMQELNLDKAGEFLALAATLIWIKSKSLLPKDALDEEEEDPDTLEELLLLRLQEYQIFKEAAVQLTGRDLLGREVFPRLAPEEAPNRGDEEQIFEEVSLYHLIEAFRIALERVDTVTDLHIIPERERIEDKVAAMFALLEAGKTLFMHDFFANDASRPDIILTFIALLEMVRLRVIEIRQTSPDGPILCQPTESLASGGMEYKRLILTSLFGEESSLNLEDESASFPN